MVSWFFLIIFWIAILLFVFYLYRKKKFIKKKSSLIFTLAMIFSLWSASMILLPPMENLFVNFQSPERVFRYQMRSGALSEVLYCNDSYMVIYSTREHPATHFIARRSEDGYHLPGGLLSLRRVAHRFDEQGIFTVYHVPRTNDYYIAGTDVIWGSPAVTESEIDIRDSNGEEIENMFLQVNYIPAMGLSQVWFFMFVEGFTDDFFLYIDGERVYIAG